jgi:hypothetical protein
MADHPFTGTLSVTGNVGIGAEPLTDTQLYISSLSEVSQTRIENSAGNVLRLAVDKISASIGTDMGTTLPFSIQTNGTSRIMIDSAGDVAMTGLLSVKNNLSVTGNVGIGTTNPKAKLDVTGNINTTGIISGSHLPPNLIRNSYMNILDGTKPAGYSVLGNVTLEAVHPYTKGFEGPYVPDKPSNAATSVGTATEANPYYFGQYNKGLRASRGGLADGWGSFPDGRILKVTGNNSVPSQTCIFFPFESNVLTNKVHFKAWLKIVSGAKVGFGVDAGYYPNSPMGGAGLILTKDQTDAAPDGWYQIDAVINISEVTNLGGTTFSMGIETNGTFEVYLALPYLANLDNDTWLPSVSDMLSRDGLTVHPSSGNVGIGATQPGAKLEVVANSHTWNGWYEAIRFGQSAHSAITHPGGNLLFGLHSDRRFYFADMAEGQYIMTIDANPSGGGNVGIGTTQPGAKLDISGGDIRWANNSRLQTDQGGSIELGGDGSTPGSGTPYIDFHFAGLTQDYNTRIINDANGRLSLVANEVFFNSTIATPGRMHITGGERLYLLNKDGVIIGKEWGGNGNLSVQGSKNFMIDHPLHPEHKYLIHSCLEGPEIAVFYRGEAQLEQGEATITLPDYFEALTRKEKRTVMLTSKLEGEAPVSMLAASVVKEGKFVVRMIDDKNPSQKFYWEVKAVRADIEELAVEEMKISTPQAIAL